MPLTRVSIVIPDSVTVIEEGAFADCAGLRDVALPRGLTELSGVTYENGGIFKGCTQLRTITIPPAVTVIGRYTFLSCAVLEEITFEGNTKIEQDAFKNCGNIRRIHAGPGVTRIEELDLIPVYRRIFQDCPGEQAKLKAAQTAFMEKYGGQ
ncbi:MAG: leucine-rich repeat domain-containing protein [Treponema sp.]|nr:leucine-rich repeat domain-containing protein [Treponema sp.]